MMKKLLTLKNAQCECGEIHFLGSKMRTKVWETAPQIPLRNCSTETVGKVSTDVILVKGKFVQSSTSFLQEVSASFVKISRYEQMQELGS